MKFGRASLQRDSAAFQNIPPRRHFEREGDILLDQQNRCASSVNDLERLVHFLDHFWGQAVAGFIKKQKCRPQHQRPTDRTHLLLVRLPERKPLQGVARPSGKKEKKTRRGQESHS